MSKIEIPKEVFENIFFKDGGEKRLEKSLTGSYQFGAEGDSPLVPNAEVEDNEYIKDTSGIRKVEGDTHEDGGVKVQLEDYSKVLSDNLEVGKEVAKEVKEIYSLKISPKDTYAKVLDKVRDKIGVSKIIKEQEDTISKLNKQQETVKDGNTLSLNTEVLTKRLNELESEKIPKEQESQKVFDYLFDMQEASKKGEKDSNIYEDGGQQQPPISEGTPYFYDPFYLDPTIFGAPTVQNQAPTRDASEWYQLAVELGGVPGVDFDAWTAKSYAENKGASKPIGEQQPQVSENATTPAQHPTVQNQTPANTPTPWTPTFGGNSVPSISDLGLGDTSTTPTEQAQQQEAYNLGIVNPLIRDEYIVRQSHTGTSDTWGLYGTEVDKAAATAETARILPSLYNAYFSDGNIAPKDVLSYQNAYNRFTDEAMSALKNFYGEDAEDYLQAETFLQSNKFTDTEGDVRYKDNLYGNYTSTRPSIAVKMLPKEELERLKKEGINTVGQLKEKYPDLYDKHRKGKNGELVDFPDDVWLGEVGVSDDENNEDASQTQSDVAETPTKNKKQEPINRLGAYLSPDQNPLPPDAIGEHLKTNRRYERMDYQDVSPEQQLLELNKLQERAQVNLDMMPPQQRAAVSSNMLATQSDMTNKVIQQTNQINQQGSQNIENMNTRIQAREMEASAQDALNYEQRQMLAEAKTDADIKRFYNTLQQNNLLNFRTIEDLNLSNALYDNFQYTDRGIESSGQNPMDSMRRIFNNLTKNMTKEEQQKFFAANILNNTNG